jgi:iron(III) transport system permease protein
VTLMGLVALLIWPLVPLLGLGFVSPPPPLAVIGFTMAVAAASTLGALGLASIVAAAVRAGAFGGKVLLGICRVGLLLPPFVVPVALLALAGHGALNGGLGEAPLGRAAAIVVAQTFAFLPLAFALVMRALADVSAEAEQAAELLGASRWTVLHRVTLGLARPRLISAAFVVLGLCLADVATPLLLGAEHRMLAAYVVTPADTIATWASGALALSVLTLAVALAGRTWRDTAVPLALRGASAVGLKPTPAARRILTTLAWLIAGAVLVLWVTVPLASLLEPRRGLTLEHWTSVFSPPRPLGHTLLLGLGVAFVGTALALVIAAVAARGRDVTASVIIWLTRVPVAIPGVVAGLGYLMVFGVPHGDLALLALLVAAWELPLTLTVAAGVLARTDRAREQAALSLGAGRLTTLRSVVLPALNPAAVWIFAHGFATGLTAVGTVIVIAERSRLDLGVTDMLRLASLGSSSAACAFATTLVALAGAATLLGRAVAGRESIPTLLA